MLHSISRSGRLAAYAAAALVFGALAAGSAAAQVARALLREDGPLPGAPAGHSVSSLNNTAVNHAGGYAVSVNSSNGMADLSHVWGNASGGAGTVMRSEGTFGSLVQTAYESFYGISDAGNVSYSATGTGGPVGNFDSVWLDDTPIAVQGAPVPSIPGQFYVFASRPGVTANGQPYWSSGYSSTPSGSSQNRVLLFGAGATVKQQGGTTPTGLPFPLVTSSISFDYRFSELGTHFIIPVVMTSGSTLHDDAMCMDGAGLVVAGTLVREQNPVPAAAGGLAGENWDNFDFCGATEAGDWFFTGDTEPSTTTDEIIVKNGAILYREGSVVDGQTLSGDMEGAYMNADGDIAYIWDILANTREALYVNDQLVLQETDLVDWTGDGVADAGKRLADFTGISSLTVSDRDGAGHVQIYFTADIDSLGTPSATDDAEGFFCLDVLVDAPVAVALESFEAASGPEGDVTLSWRTTREIDHAGFHVERALRAVGPYTRLTSDLVRGPGPYTFVDRTPELGSTAWYRLIAVDRDGREAPAGVVSIVAGGRIARNAVLSGLPNPFSGSTDLRFVLARPEPVRLAVFDARGRLVRELGSGARAAGAHAVRWDGRDATGRAVAAGAYTFRLEAGGSAHNVKIVRLGE